MTLPFRGGRESVWSTNLTGSLRHGRMTRCASYPYAILDARYFTAPEPVFWPAILELVLSGYRIQKKFREI